MATAASQLKKLEKKVAKLEKEVARGKKLARVLESDAAKFRRQFNGLLKCCDQVTEWIQQEVDWSAEVTDMLRVVNWAALATAFPGGGGTNPPQQPPVWPPK
jgi:predicted  nucleic acid-binding Zn-ribbon protein